jgi:hypothetical protein
MLRRVALVRSDVSEERSASIIRVTRIGELGTTLATRFRIPQYVYKQPQSQPEALPNPSTAAWNLAL